MNEKTTIKFKKPKSSEKRRELIPCLVVVEGNSLGETYFISKNSITIGRDEKSDLFLPEDGVSRTHARIDVHDKAHTLTDLGSTNGTYVNGNPTEQSTLHEGDKIRMGEAVLRFSYQDMMDVDYQAKLRNMAMRDGLTKLFNQKYFTDSLSREINFATRKREPLTLIMLDIDHFKTVNENFGHPSGDHVLRTVAKRLLSEVRGYDIVARCGGEEFAILLRGTPLDNALVLAERIRKQMQAKPIEMDPKEIPITVSLGVAALDPDRGASPEELVKQADRFLLEGKKRGRNLVISARNTEGI